VVSTILGHGFNHHLPQLAFNSILFRDLRCSRFGQIALTF
jgi:hypothetical protein